jgi:dTDP-4-amino-4,6-dideoxygalactose transaminase
MESRVARYRPEIDLAIKKVLDSGQFVLGDSVLEFEKSLANFIGTEYCAGVANGTDAIEIAIRALDLPPKSKIICAANAGYYASTAILSSGLIPEYVDVDFETMNVSLESLQEVFKFSTAVNAIIVTHLYGNPIQDIIEIANWCKLNKIALIEDCAQAIGATVNGKKVGSFGDVSAFSFYPTKNLGALGDGGAVLTNREDLFSRVVKLRAYGWSSKYKVSVNGGRNSRLDEMQAAILSCFLKNLDDENIRRKSIADIYIHEINNPKLRLPQHSIGSVFHLFVIRTDSRARFINHLEKNRIGSAVHYPIPDHKQELNTSFNLNLPESERCSREVLSIPLHPYLSESDIRRVIGAVNSFN